MNDYVREEKGMRSFWKNHKGVTMIEVLITVALLAIVVVPCLSSFVMAQRGNVLATKVRDEYTTAQNLMEELKSLDTLSAVIEKLEPEYEPKLEGEGEGEGESESQPKPKEYNDKIYVIYQQNTEYVTVWIFKAQVSDGSDERYNAPYNEEDPDQLTQSELILKGVIAP